MKDFLITKEERLEEIKKSVNKEFYKFKKDMLNGSPDKLFKDADIIHFYYHIFYYIGCLTTDVISPIKELIIDFFYPESSDCANCKTIQILFNESLCIEGSSVSSFLNIEEFINKINNKTIEQIGEK